MSRLSDLAHEWMSLAIAAQIAVDRARAAERAALQEMNDQGRGTFTTPLGRIEPKDGRLRYFPRNDTKEQL
jgi:hypothetical protein